MRQLKHLFIHCTATPEGQDNTGHDVADYQMRAKSKGGRGWSRPGYRLVIRLDGTIDRLVEVNDNAWVEASEITNGARGYNSTSHHICYVGGCDKRMNPKDTRTPEQEQALRQIVQWYLDNIPGIKVMGHNEVANKACPSFNVQEWLKEGWNKNAPTE